VRAGLAALALLLAAGPAARSAFPDDAPKPRGVVLTAADGVRLAATFHPSGAKHGPGAVLLPMYRSRRTAWDPALDALRERGVSVLALDLRGHGGSAGLEKPDLQQRVEARDPTLFAAMHQDAIAAVRWLAKDGGCDPERIVLVGASVGGSVALDAAARHPQEVCGLLWMSPGARSLGLDSVAQARALPAGLPVMLMAQAREAGDARALQAVRPSARLVVYGEPRPAAAGAERAWAHGTRMFGRLPLAAETVASFVAMACGSKKEDVVLDGIVTDKGPNADPWSKATDVGVQGRPGSVHAIRVGRRVLFGGVVPSGFTGLALEVQTGDKAQKQGDGVAALGPPQIVGVDLGTSRVTWSFGGVGSMPMFPGVPKLFGQTYPVLRAVAGPEGTTFEGAWTIPRFGEGSKLIRLSIAVLQGPPPGPRNGGVMSYSPRTVNLPSR
jgi:pimeloyl-ACP methyl ester carboxylesterase